MTKKILKWADERGILQKSNPTKQFVKLCEEQGELAKAILKDDIEEIKDGIGDCVVVLTILAEMYGVSIDQCLEESYNVIAQRKGKMVNSVFVKES